MEEGLAYIIQKFQNLIRFNHESYQRNKEAIRAQFLREASKFYAPSALPPNIESFIEPVIGFALRPENFSEERLYNLFCQMTLSGFWEEHITIEKYKKVFRWRFDKEDSLLIKNTMKCMRNGVDLVWVLSLVAGESGIGTEYPLRVTIPQHFLQKNGAEFDPETIDRYLRRIKKGEYQPCAELKSKILPLFRKNPVRDFVRI